MSEFGDEQPDEVEADRVRFIGGPWDGDAGRYCGLVDLANMAAPGGRYLFGGLDDDGEVVYVYEGDQATRQWPDDA